jgi:mRNA interferase HigB
MREKRLQIVARKTLERFWKANPQAEAPLRVWHAEVRNAVWRTPEDVKAQFPTGVDFVADNRIIFDILHNRFRLVVRVSYTYRTVLVKFIGTHRDYDRIDPETV